MYFHDVALGISRDYVVPYSTESIEKVWAWARKNGLPTKHIIPGPNGIGAYFDVEKMGIHGWDFIDKYSDADYDLNPAKRGKKVMRKNPAKREPLREHYNHDIREISVLENGKRKTKFYIYDDKTKKDINKLFDTQRKAILYSRQLGKKQEPGFYKKTPVRKKAVTAKKCACKVAPRKKGERLPWVIGVLNGQQKGYFTGDGFDTNPSAALLFVSEAHAKRIAKQIRGLPRGAKLFITKKPLGVIQ